MDTLTPVLQLTPHSALFLDLDGTLIDLASSPSAVVVPAGLIAMLDALQTALQGALAIVSGRPIADIDALLAPLQLAVAGVHGAERRAANGQLTEQIRPDLGIVSECARQLAATHPALHLEIKRGAVALHYRQAPELEALCVAQMSAAASQTPGLALLHGKMLVEVKASGFDKGTAIRDFMKETPFAGRKAIFLGDDVTDEAGFAEVLRSGGSAIKIGAGESLARQRLADPESVRSELARNLRLLQGT